MDTQPPWAGRGGSRERWTQDTPPREIIPDVCTSALSFASRLQQPLSHGSSCRKKFPSRPPPLLPTLETLGFPLDSLPGGAHPPPRPALHLRMTFTRTPLLREELGGPLAQQPFPLAHSAVPWKLLDSAGAWSTRNSAGSLPKPECHCYPPSSPTSAFLCQMQSTLKSWTGSSEISPELLPRLHPHCHLQASGSP